MTFPAPMPLRIRLVDLGFQHIRGNRGGCYMFLHGVAFLLWNQEPSLKGSSQQRRSSIFNILRDILEFSALAHRI
jgi:hypothetical protein